MARSEMWIIIFFMHLALGHRAFDWQARFEFRFLNSQFLVTGRWAVWHTPETLFDILALCDFFPSLLSGGHQTSIGLMDPMSSLFSSFLKSWVCDPGMSRKVVYFWVIFNQVFLLLIFVFHQTSCFWYTRFNLILICASFCWARQVHLMNSTCVLRSELN